MTRITKVLGVPATGAYYFEDLSPLQSADGVTPGSEIVRGVSEAVSVGLVLDGAQVAWGDCVSAAQSYPAGSSVGPTVSRPGPFHTAHSLETLHTVVAPVLEGRTLAGFRQLAAEVDALTESVEELRPVPQPPKDDAVQDPSRRALLAAAARFLSPYPDDEPRKKVLEDLPTETVAVERPLHPAVRYGVTQALLQAVALSQGLTMAEVIAREWMLPRPESPVPIHAQCGQERYLSADKMIVRRVASLPHALVDNVPEQVGEDGAKLTAYLRWLKERIETLGDAGYQPVIHLDVHGALGQIYENNLGKVLGRLYGMDFTAQPYQLRVEGPLILDSREAQIAEMRKLREYVQFRKLKVQLVVDEWANTLEDIQAFLDAEAADMIHIKMPELGSVHNAVNAVLACQKARVGALLGGSCAETDLSARVAVHVALAARPDVVMAKPGLGVDEAVSLVQNEMARTLAWIQARE